MFSLLKIECNLSLLRNLRYSTNELNSRTAISEKNCGLP